MMEKCKQLEKSKIETLIHVLHVDCKNKQNKIHFKLHRKEKKHWKKNKLKT